MDNLLVKTIVAGLCFGIWPMLANRSGLGGNAFTFIYVVIILACVTPFVYGSTLDWSKVNWGFVLGASLIGAVGIIVFNGMITSAPVQKIGMLFVVVTVVQTCVPALHSVIMNGGLTATKGLGFVLAIASCILLGI